MKKVLYVFHVRSTFVEADAVILTSSYKLRHFFFNASRKSLTPWYFVKEFFFLLIHIWSTSTVVSQFSGYHSFLPSVFSRIFRKPHFIILHGTECNNLPEFAYGFKMRPVLYWFSDKSLRMATGLLPVSEALIFSEYTYTPSRYKLQGLKAFYPKLKTPCFVIHNGIEPSRFSIQSQHRPVNSFITVATGLESANRRGIKGLDLIIELAQSSPENSFTFVGGKKPDGLNLPSNINVLDFVENEKLSDLYNQHAFYLQLSATEGFGISVCEAMACGCVPIVSNVGILPFIASEKGYVLGKKNINELVQLIARAQEEYPTLSLEIYRQHVIKHFDIAIRKEKLLSVLEA